MTRVAATAWAREHFLAWRTALDEREIAAVHNYKGGAHAVVNDCLRGRTEDAVDRARAEEIVPHLDRALARQRLPHAVIAYRHVGAEGLPGRWERLVGQIITDAGYSSTSLLPEYPEQLGNARGGVILELLVPAGVFAACPDLVRQRHEHELLLPRGTRIRITEVRGKHRLLGEVVP